MDSEDARDLIFKLHKASGETPIGGRVWYRRLNEQWEMWVNGNMKPATVEGNEIQAGDVYMQFNGWPAGIWNIIRGDGVIAAGGAANYDSFCAALSTAIAKGK